MVSYCPGDPTQNFALPNLYPRPPYCSWCEHEINDDGLCPQCDAPDEAISRDLSAVDCDIKRGDIPW